jgi:hypothetical protein
MDGMNTRIYERTYGVLNELGPNTTGYTLHKHEIMQRCAPEDRLKRLNYNRSDEGFNKYLYIYIYIYIYIYK